MTDRSVRVRLSAENSAFIRGMAESSRSVQKLGNDVQQLEAKVTAFGRREISVRATLDATRLDAELRRNRGARVSVNADLDTSGWREQARAAAERSAVTIKARLDASNLRAEIRGTFEAGTRERLQLELDRMRLHVDIAPRLGRVGPIPPSGGGGGGFGGLPSIPGGGMTVGIAGLLASAPQVVSLLSAAAAEATALAGQLGMAASAGAGLVPIFGAAAQGLGVLVAGTSGVRAAFKAYTTEQNAGTAATSGQASAIRSAANTIVSAREAVGVAVEGVARAQEQASRSVQSALLTEARAERDLGDAQKAELKAQADLSDARKQAKRDLEDLASQAAGGLIAERSDVLALQDAKAELARTPVGTEAYQKAQIAVDQATLSLSDQRRENARLADQQAEAARTGIDGTKGVIAAQDQVTQSVRATSDAHQAVSQAAAAVTQAQVDGARSVSDAQRGVADAQRSLAQAQQAYADATTKTSASVSKLNEAMSKLGPNQRAFVQAAISAKGAFSDLRNTIGENLFAGLDRSLHSVTTGLLPLFKTQLGDTATILNRTGRSLVDQFVGPLKGPLSNALKLNNDLMSRGSPIFGHLASAFLSIYQAAGPLAKRIVDGATGLAKFLDKASAAGLASGGLTRFFNEAGDRASALLHTLGNVGVGIGNVFKIGNEGSGGMLTGIEHLSDRFLAFTRSSDGKDRLRRWFDDGREAALAFDDLLKQIGRSFAGMSNGGGPTEIIDALRSATPYIAGFIRSLSDGGSTFRTFISAIGDIGTSLSKMHLGGTIVNVVSDLAAVLHVAADLVSSVPGLATIIGGLATAFAGLKVASAGLSLLGISTQLGSMPGIVNAAKTAFMGLTREMSAMFGLGYGASTFAAGLATVGGALALVGIVNLAQGWSNAAKDIRDASQSINDSYRIIDHGSSESTLDQQISKQQAELDKLVGAHDKYKNMSVLSGFNPLNWGDAVRGFKDGGQISSARQALDDLRGTLDGYNGDLQKVFDTQNAGSASGAAMSGNLALSTKAFASFKDEANAAGITTADTFDTMQTKLAKYRQESGSASTASAALAGDFDKLRDSTSSAADKADALGRILRGISGTQEDVQKAAIAYRGALDSVTESVKQNGKGLDDNTAAGRSNGQAILSAKDALYAHLEAMAKGGATQDQLRVALDNGTVALGKQLTATTNSKTEIAHYNDVLGLTPEQKATELQVLGALAATQAVDGVQAAMNAVTDKTVTLAILTDYNKLTAPQAAAFDAKRQRFAEANGGVVDYYANGGMRENHVAQIAPAGSMRVWAEQETGGEAYIPLSPAKRIRSLEIYKETGRRLGVLGGDPGLATIGGDEKRPVSTFANGGITAPPNHLTALIGADVASGLAGIATFLSGVAQNAAEGMAAVSAASGPSAAMTGGDPGSVMGSGGGAMAAFLRGHLGVPYSWGGGTDAGPSRGFAQGANYIGWDCSSFMKYGAWNALGQHIPRTSGAQQAALPVADKAVGNLVFYGGAAGRGGAHHVALISGPNSIIEEPHTGAFSREVPFRPGSSYASLGGGAGQQLGGHRLDFADGGIFNPHIRDTGGPLLPGYTYNGTGGPERVEYVRGPQGGSAVSAPTGPVTVNARVFIGDREITDIVRVEAEHVHAAHDRANHLALT